MNKITLNNIKRQDLAYLDLDTIIEIISNTFETKVVSYNKKYTVLEVEWEILNKEDKYFGFIQDNVNKKYKIYLTILYDSHFIVRYDNIDQLNEYLIFCKSIDSKIKNTSYIDESNKSIILGGKNNFYQIKYSFLLIPKNKDHVIINNKHDWLRDFNCDGSADLSDEKFISSYLDLNIGFHIKTFNI